MNYKGDFTSGSSSDSDWHDSDFDHMSADGGAYISSSYCLSDEDLESSASEGMSYLNEDYAEQSSPSTNIEEVESHLRATAKYWDIGDQTDECPNSNGSFDYNDDLIRELKDMFDRHNPLAASFRLARDRLRSADGGEIRMKLIESRDKDGRDPKVYDITVHYGKSTVPLEQCISKSTVAAKDINLIREFWCRNFVEGMYTS